MRVGLVCPYDMGAPGGVQQLVAELACRLEDEGDDVTVVGAGEVFEGASLGGAAAVAVGASTSVPANMSRAPLTLAPRAWARVRSALDHVDVVHVHEPLVPIVGLAALTADKPRVATFHADPPGWARRLYPRLPLSRLMRRAKTTAVSQVAASAIPAGWGTVEIIPNAINVESFQLPVERTMRRVAFLGRDEPRKGLDVLLEAWPRVSRELADAELIVMGADRGIPPPGVTYLGRVSAHEKRRVLASSAIFVAPNTRGESFGLVIAEAMAAGCAVVASDLEAFQAVMGEAGLPVPVGDPIALAEAIAHLLRDEGELAALGERARREVVRFDWSVVTPAYISAYQEALAVRLR